MRCGSSLALLLIGAALLGGCTVIRVEAGAQARVRLYPGVAVVKVAAGVEPVLVRSRMLGLGVSGDALTLGWAGVDMALIPPSTCSLILWEPDVAVATAFAGMIDGSALCNVKKGNGL